MEEYCLAGYVNLRTGEFTWCASETPARDAAEMAGRMLAR